MCFESMYSELDFDDGRRRRSHETKQPAPTLLACDTFKKEAIFRKAIIEESLSITWKV
jgi:hypothetical protein